ncbi:TPA: hypothetical protein ACPZUA_003876 [Yersinia enterocolitica]
MRWALIKDSVVVNVISWDGNGNAYKEYTTFQLPSDSLVSIGWVLDGPVFHNPNEPSEPTNLEKYKSKLSQLNASLQSDIDGLKSAYITAEISNGDYQAETQQYLKDLYIQMENEYELELASLKEQYGV